MVDVMGQTIMTGKIANGSSIDIAHLAPGMYFINLEADGHAYSPQKIIKL
jgi:hypothetical protein